uniref:Uncharacterized protein n=1 Tax=viral metagenome TaxID=1070528 RepID=A0A6M3LFK2_9ZZZZ
MSLTEKERVWIEDHFDSLRRELVKVQVDIATLKVKSGIWGVIGGSIPAIVTILIYLAVKG